MLSYRKMLKTPYNKKLKPVTAVKLGLLQVPVFYLMA